MPELRERWLELARVRKDPAASPEAVEAAERRYTQAYAQIPAGVNDRHPNFRGEDGQLYLVRCFACAPHGRENYVLHVASGVCAWCAWTPDGEPVSEGVDR